ncbi:hypothetical protein HYPSUDRAFT_139216 [Hypholoma sublateritium FD-334 SS-4]|uniref:Uncharacterized protein n=1 Tax=Hypholoma sublateritium (strain FD-334 SS-4) TaxID=945553 RepID=A0A0D2PRD3_HYPSF|nr:hypothetical protein HYPSUDRAFT_139216 [Hypholoma sublateritium FD-334 SS-4]
MERRDDLPGLASWFMGHNIAMEKATSNDDIQSALDALLSPNVSIQINGVSVSRSDYIQTIVSIAQGRTSNDVTYFSIIEVPTDPESPKTVRS